MNKDNWKPKTDFNRPFQLEPISGHIVDSDSNIDEKSKKYGEFMGELIKEADKIEGDMIGTSFADLKNINELEK